MFPLMQQSSLGSMSSMMHSNIGSGLAPNYYHQVSGSAQAKVNAAEFLDTVWETYKDTSPQNYYNFVDVLQKYQHNELDPLQLVRSGVTLLRRDRNLLDLFSRFVPPCYSSFFAQEVMRADQRALAMGII